MIEPGRESVRQRWERDGLVVVRGALSPDEVLAYRSSVSDVLRGSGSDNGTLRTTNVVGLSDRFDALLDHPAVLPLLVDVMGPYIRLLGSEAYVRNTSETPIHDWHMDGGPSLWNIHYTGHG